MIFKQEQSTRGFTMVEIALSLAVAAFALVAILGVLPTGLTVQKENREDTIINQEGRYWLEALRSGSRGLADITNHVEEIQVLANGQTIPYANTPASPLTAEQIIGLLSITPPPFPSVTNNTNRVIARVKALTGAAVDSGSLTNQSSFRYELQVFITPHSILPDETIIAAMDQDPRRAASLLHQREMIKMNLHDVRLVLRWPLFERGNGWVAGNNRKTFRTQVAGRMVGETLPGNPNMGNFVHPNKFEYVPPPPF